MQQRKEVKNEVNALDSFASCCDSSIRNYTAYNAGLVIQFHWRHILLACQDTRLLWFRQRHFSFRFIATVTSKIKNKGASYVKKIW